MSKQTFLFALVLAVALLVFAAQGRSVLMDALQKSAAGSGQALAGVAAVDGTFFLLNNF